MANKPAAQYKKQLTKLVKQFTTYPDKRTSALVNKISVAFQGDGYQLQNIPYWDEVTEDGYTTYNQKVVEGNYVFSVSWVNTHTTPNKKTKESKWVPDKVVYGLSKVVVDHHDDNDEPFLKFVNTHFKSKEYMGMWAMLRDQHHALYKRIEPMEKPSKLDAADRLTQVYALKKDIVAEVFKGMSDEKLLEEQVVELDQLIMKGNLGSVSKLTSFTKSDARGMKLIGMTPNDFLILSGVSNAKDFGNKHPQGVLTVVIKATEENKLIDVKETLGFEPDFLIVRKLEWVPEHEHNGRIIPGQWVGSHARTQKAVK